jgi:hypothetical protein
MVSTQTAGCDHPLNVRIYLQPSRSQVSKTASHANKASPMMQTVKSRLDTSAVHAHSSISPTGFQMPVRSCLW